MMNAILLFVLFAGMTTSGGAGQEAFDPAAWFTPGEDVCVTGTLPDGVTCRMERRPDNGRVIYDFLLENTGAQAASVDERAFGVVVPIDGVLAGKRHDPARAAIWHVWCGRSCRAI